MAKKPNRSTKIPGLRKQAEERLRMTRRDVATLPVKNVQQLVHELQVHQIELDMQNDELRRTQVKLEAARDRYANLYDFSPAGYLTLDRQGKIVEANLRAGTLLGIDRERLVGQSLAPVIAAEDQARFHQHWQEVLKTGQQQTCEVRLRIEAGVARWFYFESLAVHDEAEYATLWRTAFLDISDRKLAEDEVRRSEVFVSSVLEHLPVMVFVKEAKDLRFVRLNKAGEDLLGYLGGELMGKNDYDFFPQDEADFFTAKDREVLASGRLLDIPQEPIQTRFGEVRHLHTKKIPIVGKDGRPQYLLGISEDITDHKRVEDALRLAKFSMDRAADAIYWVDPQAKILDVNEAASRMLGYSKDELCAMTVHDLNPDFQADRWPGFWAETQRRGTMALETAHRAKNGRLIPIEVSVNFLFYEGKEYHCAFVRDITERRQAEGELRESEARLRAILDHSPGMVFLKDAEGHYLEVNRQFERAFHMTREQVVGQTDEAIFVPEQAALFRANDLKVFQAGVPLEFEEVAMHDDGPHTSIVSKFPLYGGDGKPYALCGITTDITWRKIAEKSLQASNTFTRAVLNSLSAHICVLDKKGVILKTNDAWKEFARRYVDDAYTHGDVGDKYLDRCQRTTGGDASTSQAIFKGIEAVLMGDEPGFSAEYQTLSPEVPRWFLIRATPLKESQGVVISHTDISERVRMARLLEQHIFSLREKREELESLTKKLIDAQEEENKRIARDLHDDFNQRLAALAVELESVERIPIAWPEPVAQQLAMIRCQVVELSDDLHDLAYRLHPSLLDHVGLEIAARDHVAEFTKKTGLPVRFTARDVPGALSPEIATNLFRMIQESLQNVAKHAQATEVTVRLSGSSKGIGLSVCDNGKGFDLENKDKRIKGLGLVSMQERARSLGGFLSIHSSEKTGTKVCAFIPRSSEGL
jgi:PAS domain S-box-containing protein